MADTTRIRALVDDLLARPYDPHVDTTRGQDIVFDILTGPLNDGTRLRAIAAARKVVEDAEALLVETIREAIGAGDSWTMVGLALHTSKQNAHRKYAALVEDRPVSKLPAECGYAALSAMRVADQAKKLLVLYQGNSGEEVNMANDNNRHVVPAKEGGWDVVKPGSSRPSSHHDTQADAISRGRDIVRNAGGGELNIHGRNGEIRAKDTIPPGNDPRNVKG